MLVKGEKSKSTYQVSYVRREMIRGKPVTKFSIRDPVKGVTAEFVTFGITVWDDIPVKDGDHIRLLDFDNIVASYHAEKRRINFFMSAVVEIVPSPAKGGVGNPFEGG